MFNKIKHALTSICGAMLLALTLSGCGAEKNVLYFQNLTPDGTVAQATGQPIEVKAGDEIMVYVSSSDAEMAARLTLLSGSQRPNAVNGTGVQMTTTSVMLPYTVNDRGNIAMPMIGDIHVAGLTRQQIARKIEKRIINDRLVKNNSINVTVQFANLTFSTLGEVKTNDTYNIVKDDLTVLEALAMAGDLTIYGRRDAVWVLREQPDGTRKSYKLDLRGTAFLESPAYYVKQNDIIYVEPNSVRAGQSTLNENTFKSVGFWTSLASLAITIATFAITLSR